ncbi:uncharacterized protein LOC126848034 [Adelges cooleyi]|uniref:uncharacterized protein LOC126848034 n=1 Tax=Adelges cooleyi TaxID=133065 RepID=UPI00217F7CCF|nr:uncharacterized protein LOC126848034 [Adelges cooleyi]
MHFKSAVILCAVNFISSVWSTGLNKDQIEICIRMSDPSNPGILHYIRIIKDLMKSGFGIEKPEEIFQHDPRDYYCHTFKRAFLALAYSDNKTSDSFGVPMLTTFEIEYYINKFHEHLQLNGQYSFLSKEQLLDLFGKLHLTEDEKAKAESLANREGDKIQSAILLSIMLEILPEGNGLNEAQIEEFIELYRYQDTVTRCIEPLKIQNILNTIHMAIEPLEESMLFKSNRPFAKVLMELVIITAERFRTDNKKDEIVLSTKEIRSLLYEFTERDRNRDGVLFGNEASKFVREFIAKNPQIPTLNFNYNEIHVAKFLLFHIHAKKVEEP